MPVATSTSDRLTASAGNLVVEANAEAILTPNTKPPSIGCHGRGCAGAMGAVPWTSVLRKPMVCQTVLSHSAACHSLTSSSID